MSEPLNTSIDGAITTISLNAPAFRNALGAPGLRDALNAAIAAFEADITQRVCILTGAGGVFSAGGDLKALIEIRDEATFRERLDRGAWTTETILTSSKLYVAAVEGPAFGAAFGMALACDIVVASASARFCAAQVRVGAVPDGSMFWSIPRRTGNAVARRLFLTGEEMDCEAALACGAADYAASEGAALSDATAVATRLAKGPPHALGQIKSFFVQNFAGREETLVWERSTAAKAFASAEFQEGASAFLEKRKPDFGSAA